MTKVGIRLARSAGDSGAAAVEFAIVLPMLCVMLFGIVAYGGYFWIAHAVQQLANDSARAAVAGLDSAERQSLAQASLNSGLSTYAYLKPSAATLSLSEQNQEVAVTVNYDAAGSPFWSLKGLIPMPPTLIHRQAVVRLGGY